MNKYIYVDTENIGLKFIDIVKNMDKTWTVIIFYTEHTPRLPFDAIESIRNLECNIEFVRCFNGTPNALDFSLVTQLGISVVRRPRSVHIILSDDNGFDASLRMLDIQGYKVCRYSVLNGIILFTDNSILFKEVIDGFKGNNSDVKLPLNCIHKIMEVELRKIGLSSEDVESIKQELDRSIVDKVLLWDILEKSINSFELFKGALGKNHCNTLRQRIMNKLQTYGYRLG